MRHAIAAVLAVLAAAPTAGAQWVGVGHSATGDGLSGRTETSHYTFGKDAVMALDAQGRPIVAWQAGTTNSDIYLRAWDGRDWIELGGSASAYGISASSNRLSTGPALRIDSQGRPVVAWAEAASGSETSAADIHVRHWDGETWATYGSAGYVLTTTKDSKNPALALNALDQPIVAWEEYVSTGKPEIWVRGWNGMNWNEVGGASSTGGGISGSTDVASIQPSISVGPGGKVAVAWQEGLGIHLKQWDSSAAGSTWVALGGSASGPGVAFDIDANASTSVGSPSVLYHPLGVPGVAWTATKFNSNLSVVTSDVFFRYFTPVPTPHWTDLGGSGGPGGLSNSAAISTHSVLAAEAGGNPVIAWREKLGDDDTVIHLERWTGSIWEEIAGSATDGGLSGADLSATTPSIAVAADGRPYVSFGATPDRLPQIYLKALNGAATASAPLQFRADGTSAIVPGDVILERSFEAEATVSLDPEGHDSMIEVEVSEAGPTFVPVVTATSAPVPGGEVASVLVTGIPRGLSYRWRLRARDEFGAVTAWVEFGADPLATDFSIRSNLTPVTELLNLIDPDDGHALAVGERFFSEAGMRIMGTVADGDGDNAGLEIEAKLLGEDFDETRLLASPRTSPDGTVTFDVQLPNGTYHARVRGIDALGEGSPWIHVGGNAETEADFTIINPGGSLGMPLKDAACSGTGRPGAGWALAALLIFCIFATGSSRPA